MAKYVSAEILAEMLTDAAKDISRDEFVRVFEDILGDTETSDEAKIASYMPPELQGLIPRKYLH